MDIEQQRFQATEVPAQLPTQVSQATPLWPAPQARPVLPVYNVEDHLRRRSLRTIIGRIAIFALDAVML
ncbi:MAG: hypothetical protein ACXWQZ_19835, partial [Ktedonobacterales bacterium]